MVPGDRMRLWREPESEGLTTHPNMSTGPDQANNDNQVGADAPAAPTGFVDHDTADRTFAAVPVAGVDDAVLDHHRGRAAGVPVELVEPGDVHYGNVLPITDRVPLIAG